MAKKQKPIDSGPSKAYLVSFGDTMTALLAFFIVLNSLATEQTGANMYSGTGSFVNAFSKSGTAGGMPGNRSRDMIQQNNQAPIYAIGENLHKNVVEEGVGPDDSDHNERVIDREKEQFQKFLQIIEQNFGLETQKPFVNQVVVDSFERFDRDTEKLSGHAIQLAAELFPKLRENGAQMEIIIWAKMPSKSEVVRKLKKSFEIKSQVEELFWITPEMKKKIKYNVKPWLFSDAKRPVISFVISETE